MGWVLPSSPHHKLHGTHHPLGERAQVLREAAWLVRCHMAVGQLLRGAPTDQHRSLPTPGGRFCHGLRARPHLAARAEIALQLPHLALQRQDTWPRRLRGPAHLQPGAGGGGFPMGYFPRMPNARDGCRRCCPLRVPLAAPQVHHGMWGPIAWSTERHLATGAGACGLVSASAATPATGVMSAAALW